MTVIGSVEFEASLSLDKFNQQLDNLIAKNKNLAIPVEVNLGTTQFSKIKTNLPTLKVKVDDSALSKLNKHLDLKRKHHVEIQQYFNSNPLTIKTDNRELDQSIQKFKELRNEINSFKRGLGSSTKPNGANSSPDGSKVATDNRFPVKPSGGSGGASQTINTLPNPIDDLPVQVDKSLSKVSKEIAVQGDQTLAESKRASEQISKTIESTSKQGFFSKAFDGLILGFGQNLTKEFSQGLLKGFQQATGIKSGQVGKAIGGFTGSTGKNAIEFTRKTGRNILNEIGISEIESQVRDAFSDAIVTALDESVTLTDLFTNLSKELAKALDSQEVQGVVEKIKTKGANVNTYAKAVGFAPPKENGSILQAAILQEIGKKIAPQLEKLILKSREDNLGRRAIPLVLERVSQILNESESEPLTEKAITDGIKKAEKLKGKVVKGVDASMLAMGKLVAVDAPAAVREETKELIITIGGYAGDAKSASGMRIAGELVYEYNKMGRKDIAAIGLANPDTNLKPESMKEAATKMQALLSSVIKPNIRGYSKDAVELAAQAISAMLSSPDLKVKLLGESGGGFAVEEAIKILNEMGFGDRVEGAGFGTPNLIGGLNPENYKKYIGKDPSETLGYETHQVYAPAGFADVSPPEQNLTGLTGHPYEHYAPLDEFKAFAFNQPKSGKITPGKPTIDPKQIQEEIKKIKKILADIGQIPGSSSQDIKAYLTQISKSLAQADLPKETFGDDLENINKAIEIELANIDPISQYKAALEKGKQVLQQVAYSDDDDAAQNTIKLLKRESAKVQNALFQITQSTNSKLAKSLMAYFRDFQMQLSTWGKSGKNEMQLDIASNVAEQKLKELIDDFDKDTAVTYSKAIAEMIANFDMGSAKNPAFATEKLEKLSDIYNKLNDLLGETVEQITENIVAPIEDLETLEPIEIPTIESIPPIPEVQKINPIQYPEVEPPVLSSEEIKSIANDLKTYFKSKVLQETLKSINQEPTGKNASDYAEQLARSSGAQALSKAYQTGGKKGLTQKGKSKEQSLSKERLLEQQGYQILRDSYAKLKRELQQKEQELKQLVSAVNKPGEETLRKDLTEAAIKALEASEAVKQTVAEIESIKESYNIPQSIGQNISGMVDALKSYGLRAEKLAEEVDQGSVKLERIALPELKLSDYEKVLEPLELPKQFQGINANQQMLGLSALGGLGALFGNQGAASAATGAASVAGGTAIAPIAIPIALTLAGGVGAIKASQMLRPFLEKEAPQLAKLLYLDIGESLQNLGGKVKNNLDKLFKNEISSIENIKTPQEIYGKKKINSTPEKSFGQFAEEERKKEQQNDPNSLKLKNPITQLDFSVPAPLKSLLNTVQNLGKAFLGFSVLGFVQNQLQNIASATFEVTTRFVTLENTINFLSGGTKAGAKQMQFLRAEIERTSASIEPVLQSYKKLAASTRNTSLEGGATNKLTSSLMQAGTVFGLTGEELEGSILAISQIAGKGCHGKGSLIRMADGSTKKVEDIKVGDYLMGADKKPRKVLMLAHGTEELWNIKPEYGESFIVNRSHKMRLFDKNGVKNTVNLFEFISLEPQKQKDYRLINEHRNAEEFTIEQLDAGEFFGFFISGDHLYLDAQGYEHHNTVSLEELRGQLAERIPGAFQIAARSMNTTEQELFKLISTGQLAASDFLPKFAKQLDLETAGGVEGAANTTRAAITRLQNSIIEMQVVAGKEFQGPLVLGIGVLNSVLKVVSKNADTFVQVLKVAVGAALVYATPAMFAFAKGLIAIPMAGTMATYAVSGLSGVINGVLLPALSNFLVITAGVWVAIEAFKVLYQVWDTFTSKTTSQTWAETLSKNLQKSRKDVEDLTKEFVKANKINTPRLPNQKPQTEYGLVSKRIDDDVNNRGLGERLLYHLDGRERAKHSTELTEAAIQTVTDSREVKQLQQDRKTGAFKQLREYADSAMTEENVKRVKDLNAQIEQLRQKSTLTKDLGSQNQIKAQIEQLRKLRDIGGTPLADSLKYVNVELENHKKRINETNDDRLREELQANVVVLEDYKKKLQDIERQTGAQTTLSELMKVLSKLRVEMETFNRVAGETADKNLKAIANTELQGLRTDIFASADAGLKRSENALSLVQAKIKTSQDTVKGLQGLLNEPLMAQYSDFYKGNSLEQLKVDLEGVDEADAQRRKALEAMILLREQESGLIGLQREEAEANLALEKERSQVLLGRFENAKAEAQNQVQVGESRAMAGITQQQLKGQIKPYQTEALRAEVSLDTAKQNQKLAQEQLNTLRNYYQQGKITAEEFNTRRRELELQAVQTVQQVGEQELQLRQAVQQEIIGQIERRVAVSTALQQQGENASTEAIRQLQLDRVINEQQAEARIANVRKQGISQSLQINKTQLEELRAAYAQRKIEETEFRQRERELMTQSSDLSRQLIEQELQVRQAVQQDLLSQMERRMAVATALQQQGENAATQAVRQQQLNRVITEQQAEVQVSQIRKQSLIKNLQATQAQLQELRKAYQERKISELEFRQRERDLITQTSDLNRQIVEQGLQIQQQKQQLILDNLERQNQKLEHQLKLQDAIAQLNQKSAQINRETVGTREDLFFLGGLRGNDTRTRSGEDVQSRLTRQREDLKLNLTRQTEDETLALQQATSTRYQAELERRLSVLKGHFQKGELSQREYEDRSRQIEQELTSTKVQLKDYELQQTQRLNQRQVEDFERTNQRIAEDRERLYRRLVEDFERSVKKQESALQLSAIQQEQGVRNQQLSQTGLVGSQRAEQQAAITLTRIQEQQLKKQLKSTVDQIKKVAKLREQNALTEREAEERTTELTIKAEQLRLDLTNKQIEKTRQLNDLRIQGLDDELARIDTAFQRREMGLTYELEQRKQIVDSLDREKSILDAQSRLQQALIRGEEQRGQSVLDRSRRSEDLMSRLPDLQKQLSEGGLNYSQQRGTQYLRELIQQISGAQTGNAMLPESQLQQLRTNQYNESVNAEQRLLGMKTRHLEQQQRIQLAQTELQQRMNRLTAENNVMEANIAVNKAKQAELQAKIALDKARVNGDPREIQNAQLAYDLAQQNTTLSQQQFGNAVERLTTADQLSGLDKQATLEDQANDRFALGESNRKAVEDLALRGGELASQGGISIDSMIKVDPMEALRYGLEPIAPVVDLTSQINSKFDLMLAEMRSLNNKPASASVESLTIVSSDPTGDSRQVLDEMSRARNMYR